MSRFGDLCNRYSGMSEACVKFAVGPAKAVAHHRDVVQPSPQLVLMFQRETSGAIDNHHLCRVLVEPLLRVVERDPWVSGAVVGL